MFHLQFGDRCTGRGSFQLACPPGSIRTPQPSPCVGTCQYAAYIPPRSGRKVLTAGSAPFPQSSPLPPLLLRLNCRKALALICCPVLRPNFSNGLRDYYLLFILEQLNSWKSGVKRLNYREKFWRLFWFRSKGRKPDPKYKNRSTSKWWISVDILRKKRDLIS